MNTGTLKPTAVPHGRNGRGYGCSLRMAALVLAICLLPGAPQAASREARFGVGAVVLARATIAAETDAPFLEVTQADIGRGYVDARRATRLVIANTSPLGFALDVWPAAALFDSVEVTGAGTQATLATEGGAITLRGVHGPTSELILDFRFALAPGLQPGRYPWPLRFDVRPLTGP
jgi:hypothetical protein